MGNVCVVGGLGRGGVVFIYLYPDANSRPTEPECLSMKLKNLCVVFLLFFSFLGFSADFE